MSNPELNPYLPPQTPSVERPQFQFRWRMVPAVLFFSIGGISLCIALFIFACGVMLLAMSRLHPYFHQWVPAVTLYTGPGVAWLLAGRFYWSGQFRHALIATAVGIVIPVVLFSIIRF